MQDVNSDLEKEKVGDWLIEKYNYPDYTNKIYGRIMVDISAYIETDNGSIQIECLSFTNDKYPRITFYLKSESYESSLRKNKSEYVNVKVRIDDNDPLHFVKKKYSWLDTYISDTDIPPNKEVVALLKQMRKGNVMIFEVDGAKKSISNEISLRGFNRAYNILKEGACIGM